MRNQIGFQRGNYQLSFKTNSPFHWFRSTSLFETLIILYTNESRKKTHGQFVMFSFAMIGCCGYCGLDLKSVLKLFEIWAQLVF